jgi:hypothetical protein
MKKRIVQAIVLVAVLVVAAVVARLSEPPHEREARERWDAAQAQERAHPRA